MVIKAPALDPGPPTFARSIEMPHQSPQFGVISLNRAIDHYFELALYLLVLTGFGTLASTGGLDTPATALVGVALAIRGFQLAKRKQFVISEQWTTPLSIAYFVFFAADYFIFSRSFLPAVVHLALFVGEIQRCLTRSSGVAEKS